jgi:feruloyl-CoA synthase
MLSRIRTIPREDESAMSSFAPDEHDFVDVELAPPSFAMERRNNGEILLRSTIPLADHARHVGEFLLHWARTDPARTFLAERNTAGVWQRLSYGDAARKTDAISQWLIDNGHDGERPVAALCDNCIHMGLLKLGAMQIGIPFLPISPAYSLMSENFAKLKHVVAELRPSLIYVPSLAMFGRALKALDLTGIHVVADAPHPDFPEAVTFDQIQAVKPGPEVARRRDAVTPDTIAKILLTSGSTGMPKGVINTQRMLCSNGKAVDQVWIFLTRRPPILVDWLPWNHTFGTNFNFGQVLRHGGTLYIDAGRPMPGKLDTTLKNLREIQQTVLYNVPRGYDMLLPALEADDEFGRHVFGKLDAIFYAGAALPPHLWQRLNALAVKHRGKRLPIFSSLGSTETAPVASFCHWPASDFDGVGLPIPGTEIKLVPDGSKLEFRVRGANVTPGYYNRPDLSAQAFDQEGFFRMGDAVAFIDPNKPEKGLRFDGRVSENFKLMSGTWVQVGDLRLSAISAAAPAIQDAVVTGHDREEVGLMVFPNIDGCRQICNAPDASLADLVARPELHAHIAKSFQAFNAANPGTSRQIARVLLLSTPPSVDGNEITDKGYINQRAVLEARAKEVARLYSGTSQPDVVVVPREAKTQKQTAA